VVKSCSIPPFFSLLFLIFASLYFYFGILSSLLLYTFFNIWFSSNLMDLFFRLNRVSWEGKDRSLGFSIVIFLFSSPTF